MGLDPSPPPLQVTSFLHIRKETRSCSCYRHSSHPPAKDPYGSVCNTLQHTATHCNTLQHKLSRALDVCTMQHMAPSQHTSYQESRRIKRPMYLELCGLWPPDISEHVICIHKRAVGICKRALWIFAYKFKSPAHLQLRDSPHPPPLEPPSNPIMISPTPPSQTLSPRLPRTKAGCL